jgi:hypothetical protein
MTMHQRLTTIAAGLTLGATALLAQVTGGTVGGQNFQQAGTLMPRPVDGWSVIYPLGARPIPGSPFSATEERHSRQTLGDGTVLETSETNVLYRDNDGRTRSERTAQGKTMITITDPVARTTIRLDPANKMAFKAGPGLNMATSLPSSVSDAEKAALEAAVSRLGAVGRGAAGAGTPASTMAPEDRAKLAKADLDKVQAEMQARANSDSRTNTEDLGMLQQNGVPAQGTRTTLTIPVGQIGNNREIKVVNERWYSQELQMTVKSVNSDPRFGTTTYELRNVTRSNPPINLFQIPSDYTVSEGGGRGGRGRGGQ